VLWFKLRISLFTLLFGHQKKFGGVMGMSWHNFRLGDVLTLQRGHDLPNTVRLQGYVPVVSSSGITGHHNEAKATAPGVVTGRYGTIGEVFYIEQDYWPLNTALYVTDFKGNHPRFIAYLLRNALRNYKSDKAAIPGVNRNVLHELKILFPDTQTQQRIASILSAYDDLIENNRRRIQLLEQAARLLYKEWFVHLRFPGHEHTKIPSGIPEGWGKKRLGEVASMNVKSYKARELPDEINYIDISSVTRGRISSKAIFSSDEAPGRARRKAKSGDVIWSNVRPNLRAYALVIEPEDDDVFSTGFTVLTPTAIPFTYLYLLVTTDEFVSHLVNHATGASYPAVRPDDFERANVLVPSRQILGLFHEKTEPNFRLISMLEKENKSLTKARDLLLPRLMNGEVAV
jgi:type I restriction enzyme, S subunit